MNQDIPLSAHISSNNSSFFFLLILSREQTTLAKGDVFSISLNFCARFYWAHTGPLLNIPVQYCMCKELNNWRKNAAIR